ncbi:hypothetical protein SAMN02910369_01470 [Lachnospiraceae bacterium NE2001]|nr:hypothetical protein SAMN02910369_01470 [Lachnospiraceae bacterium NE2001]
MTLLITIFAAVVATYKWYTRKNDDSQLSILVFMYWGASLMWMVDAVFEYAELKAEYFSPAPADMLNDAFLGLCVVALGLIVWIVRLLIKDPKGVLRKSLQKESVNN